MSAPPQNNDVLPTSEQLKTARKAVISGSIGNALEWFDISVYASFAVYIQRVFFPTDDPTIGLLVAFAAFASSYIIRPLGGMILGSYADRRGRKAALTLTIFLMLVGTTMLAIAPPASVIGVGAGVIVLVARLIQGFSAGGEFGTSTTFMAESAPHRKIFYASWQATSQGAALFLASAFGFVLISSLSDAQLESWGWRVPFFFGMLVGPVGWYIRSQMTETEEFSATVREQAPLKAVLTQHFGRVLTGIGCVGIATITIFLIFYMPTFAATNFPSIGSSPGYLGGVVAGVVTMIIVPFAGALADRIGAVKVMMAAGIGALVLAWPLFAVLIDAPSMPMFVVVIAVLGVINGFYFGPLPGFMTALFPVEVRGTGLSVSYNVAVTLMGGIAPFVLTALIASTGSLYSPSIYYMAICVISLVALYFARSKFQIE